MVKMEEKQLNFDAPLLSVRKSTSLSSSDRQQKHQQNKIVKSSRIKITEIELEEVTKMGKVPFIWEQIPGTPKNIDIRKLQIIPKQPLNTPKLPPGRRNSCDSPSDHSDLIEILRESDYKIRESDSEEGVDDVYSDADEVFESMSLNCSTSGLSDYQVSNRNQYEKFKLDEQTGEFMMNRFLPAAKAAILDKPKYVSKKRSVTVMPEHDVLADVRKSSNHRYYANLVFSDYQYVEENKHDNHKKRSMKISRFIPHLCVKDSLCIVKPMVVVKPKAAKSATNDITRLSRKAYSGPIDKVKDQNDTKRHHSGVLSKGFLHGDSTTYQSTRFSCSGGLSPFMASRKDGYNQLCGFLDTRSDLECVTTRKRVILEEGSEQVNGETVNMQISLFPPLPKSPAESWLYQTVSNEILRNPSLQLNHDIKINLNKPEQKPYSSSTKWETIVKTSHLHRSNCSFSEELVRHISH